MKRLVYNRQLQAARFMRPEFAFTKGTRVAVDFNLYLYWMAHRRGLFEIDDVSEQGRILADELNAVNEWICNHEVSPIYVKDGSVKPLKARILAMRKTEKQSNETKAVEEKKVHTKIIKEMKKTVTALPSDTAVAVGKAVDELSKIDGHKNEKDASAAKVKKTTARETVKNAIKKSKSPEVKKQLKKVLKEEESTSKEFVSAKKKSFGIRSAHWRYIYDWFERNSALSVTAKGDADAECAALCKLPSEDPCHSVGVLSDDMDCLAFGAPVMYTQLRNCYKSRSQMGVVDLHRLLHSMSMTYPEFVHMCVLLGCDYVSPHSSTEAIKLLNSPDELKSFAKESPLALEAYQLPEFQAAVDHYQNADSINVKSRNKLIALLRNKKLML